MNTQGERMNESGQTIFFALAGVSPGIPQLEWVIGELRERLAGRGVALEPAAPGPSGGREATHLRIALYPDEEAGRAASLCSVNLPATPESFAIFRVPNEDADRLHVCGSDIRGLVYALAELADRVRCGTALADAFAFAAPLVECPTAKVRSISKCFVSEIEDLPWFRDRQGWEEYLTMLATHRFNRFTLTLGMQYNYPYGNEFMSDVYLHLAYPFLVAVPGHDVSISNLSDEERRLNLDSLRFIAREADRRGLDFQLALWTQNYDFDDCPDARHRITGLGAHNIAPYCRDALALLLEEVPQISGLTLRVHVECGIPEGDYGFWRTYFEAVKGAGRTIRLDLHAKGIDSEMIDVALETGMPVGISPKYTSEHLGLPYHQMSIRALELPADEASPSEPHVGRDMTTLYSGRNAEEHARKWKFSEGSRKFMRYSHGDLLREGRPYGIMYRIWPGTTRILLWGDPALAGGYGRNAGFCGAQGIELCEPLSFKGRMGTGVAGSRTGYREKYRIHRHDWQKFEYTYRVWGRSLFDPQADPEAFHRFLRSKFGEAAGACGAALANASRILPLITLAHTPTASNNSYWPELYENMSLVHPAPRLPYGYELPVNARFGTVGSCDPQFFMAPDEFAACLYEGRTADRIAPLTWANRLEQFALAASRDMVRVDAKPENAELFLFAVDVAILSAIGRFFADKVRAAVFWEYYLLSGERDAAERALGHYRKARDAWAQGAQASREVYESDITYGPHSWLRGRWDDRLPAIEQDIADMEALVAAVRNREPSAPAALDIERISGWSYSQVFGCRHTPPDGFVHGAPLEMSATLCGGSRRQVSLHYRHVDQSQRWCRAAMTWRDGAYRAVVPADYTSASFPLMYYFELHDGDASAFHPGLGEAVTATPYFVLEGTAK